MITRELLEYGYKAGLVTIVKSPNGDGVVGQIGDNWFYFGGEDAEECDDPELFVKERDEKEILDRIYDVMEDFRASGQGFEDEYAYYEAYLKEILLLKEDLWDKLDRKVFVVDDDKKRIVVTLGSFDKDLDPIAAVKAAVKDFFQTSRGKELAESHWVFTYSDFLHYVPLCRCANNGFVVIGVEEVTDIVNNSENLNN